MKSANDLSELVRQIDNVVETSVLGSPLPDHDLRSLLLFISQVIQVVEQAFQDVIGILVDVSLLRLEDLGDGGQLRDLQRRIGLLTARSYYRDAAEICSRLKYLGENFDQYIRPKVSHLPGYSGWGGVFGLIEHREGRIIRLVEDTARDLEDALSNLNDSTLAITKAMASDRKRELA